MRGEPAAAVGSGGGCIDKPGGYGLITVLEIDVSGVVDGDQA